MGFINYLKDTKAELAHVSWPSPRQTIYFTLIVVAVSILVAFFLGLFDYVFTYLLETYILR